MGPSTVIGKLTHLAATPAVVQSITNFFAHSTYFQLLEATGKLATVAASTTAIEFGTHAGL